MVVYIVSVKRNCLCQVKEKEKNEKKEKKKEPAAVHGSRHAASYSVTSFVFDNSIFKKGKAFREEGVFTFLSFLKLTAFSFLACLSKMRMNILRKSVQCSNKLLHCLTDTLIVADNFKEQSLKEMRFYNKSTVHR